MGFDWDKDYDDIVRDGPAPRARALQPGADRGAQWRYGAALGLGLATALLLAMPARLGLSPRAVPVSLDLMQDAAPLPAPDLARLRIYTDSQIALFQRHSARLPDSDLMRLAARTRADARIAGHPLAAHFHDALALTEAELARRGLR